MGGGDLNAKKAWHPNTLKNQERVWKAEQAAAEEKKRIAELERERHLERERAELNKLAKSNMAHSGLPGDDRLHWMYEKPDKKVQQEEYLLGKAIDKSHEQTGKTDADEIPAVSRRVVGSSMLTSSGDIQVDLARKMREDPLLLVKERERAARAALLNNPVQRAKLTELLRKEQAAKNESKLNKKNKKSKDLDNILAEKLQALSGKKGIDLASLLASDDSSSESSDEKSKKKKKKKKKKSKNKNVSSDDSDQDTQKHKSKYDSNNEFRKVKKQNKEMKHNDSDHAKRKQRQQFSENESAKSHVTKHRRDSSDDRSSDDNHSEQQKRNSKHSAKKELKKHDYLEKLKKTGARSDNFDNTRKRRHYSTENDLDRSHIKKHRDTSKDHQSSDGQQTTDDEANKRRRNYGKEDRYWNNKQYSKEYQSKDDNHTRTEGHRKKKHSEDNRHRNEREERRKHEREGRHRESYRDSKNSLEDSEYKKDKSRSGSNVEVDKSRQSTKRSGLSEAEKASKLAEMMAAGAERERQRERRVANQLAEKEIEEKPNTYSRSRNAVQQLPESLESRIHSNRHYIQRDQRHMNENFARR